MKLLLNMLTIMVMLATFISCNLVKMQAKSDQKDVQEVAIRPYFLKNDSLTVKYWKGGNGPVVVLIHGFGGNAILTWKNEMMELVKNHTVIAPDVVWFGESRSTLKAELSTQRKAIEAILQKENITHVSVIGQSYGGFIAIDFAMNNIRQMNRLCVANCPGTTFDVGELDAVCVKNNLKSIDELFIFENHRNVQRLMNACSYHDRRLPAPILKQIHKSYFNQNHNELRALLSTLPNERNRLWDIKLLRSVQSMVLWGEEDEIFSMKEGKKFADTIQANFITMPNCGHMPQTDNPRKFTQIITAFLDAKND